MQLTHEITLVSGIIFQERLEETDTKVGDDGREGRLKEGNLPCRNSFSKNKQPLCNPTSGIGLSVIDDRLRIFFPFGKEQVVSLLHTWPQSLVTTT